MNLSVVCRPCSTLAYIESLVDEAKGIQVSLPNVSALREAMDVAKGWIAEVTTSLVISHISQVIVYYSSACKKLLLISCRFSGCINVTLFCYRLVIALPTSPCWSFMSLTPNQLRFTSISCLSSRYSSTMRSLGASGWRRYFLRKTLLCPYTR